ncbi:hypothetical protein BST61_g11548 [Cercospora zeina]
MALFSILPETWRAAERCISRIFLVGAVLIIGPWLAFLLYDFLLYICRMLIHNMPYWASSTIERALPRQQPSGNNNNNDNNNNNSNNNNNNNNNNNKAARHRASRSPRAFPVATLNHLLRYFSFF